MMTPEGYYVSSDPEVEKSLVVRWGEDLLDVTDISAYRERFYRPDLVQAVLNGVSSTHTSRRLSDVRLSPTVEITSLPNVTNTDKVTLGLRLNDRGGGVGEVRVSINGSTVASLEGRGAVRIDGSQNSTMTLPLVLEPRSNLIRVVAFNKEGRMRSEPALGQVTFQGARPRKPVMHVLAIGIDDFANPRLKLRNAVADAQELARTMSQYSRDLFESVQVTTLTALEQTTRTALLETLRKYREIDPGDVFVLFIPSHGMVYSDQDGGQDYFLVTSNVGSTSAAALARDAIAQRELKASLAAITARKSYYFFTHVMQERWLSLCSHPRAHADLLKTPLCAYSAKRLAPPPCPLPLQRNRLSRVIKDTDCLAGF